MAGNRTRVNCLEGSYAHHYTTIAPLRDQMLLTEQYVQDKEFGRGEGVHDSLTTAICVKANPKVEA